MTASDRWFRRAERLMPGGVNSPVRAMGGVGSSPLFLESGQGCRVTDVDGREYIDYVGSWGPLILGHRHEAVVSALSHALTRGVGFGLSVPVEVELAEEVVARVPGVEKVRMVNSGTEAVMSALRLARAATGRSKIIKFAGCYHGHTDAMLCEAGSGVATLAIPGTRGVTPGAVEDTLVAPFGDSEFLERLVLEHAAELAAVIVEPVAGNMGVVPPPPEFLERLRQVTKQTGALLIFDEVMTGFRVSRGGAQERFGIQADITTFGKILGGGLPVGAYGGSAVLMDLIAPAGPVYQAGTLSGNPLAMTAGLATLTQLDEEVYNKLEQRSSRLQQGLEQIVKRCGEFAIVQRVGSMLTLFFTETPVRNFDDAKRANHERFGRFFRAMLDQGVLLPPSGFEAWFVSLSHDDEAIDATLLASQNAFDAM